MVKSYIGKARGCQVFVTVKYNTIEGIRISGSRRRNTRSYRSQSDPYIGQGSGPKGVGN